MSDALLVEARDAVRVITINRPEQRNSLPPADWLGLARILGDIDADVSARVIVIRGAGGRAFSSGYDINALRDLEAEGIVLSTSDDPFEIVLAAVVSHRLPVIAMIEGFAVGGGCTLAAGCDIRVAGTSSRFGMPPAKLGLLYSANELQPFVELIGAARAKLMFFSGRIYPAQQAEAFGLVDVIVPDEEVETFTFELAEEIAANAPLSVQGTKRVLRLMGGPPAADGVAGEIEATILAANTSADLREGVRAFLEKRKPDFRGR